MRDVTAIIPARTDEPFLAEALASVLCQGERVLEVLVCTDDLAGASAREAGRHGPRVRAVRSEGGEGHQNLNAGLARAQGTWLAFLDADDVWPEDRLARAFAAFDAAAELDVCFGHQRAIAAGGTLGEAVQPAPLLGTALMRRETALRIGPFQPGIASAMDWLLRAGRMGLRSVTIDHVLLHRRVHADNLSRRRRPELHAAYLAMARRSLREQRGERAP